MADVRSGHLIFGVGLVLMGYALMVIALAEQAQRSAAAAGAQPSTVGAPADDTTPVAPVAMPPVVMPGATTAPAASIAPAAAEASDTDVKVFKFSPGGAIMSRDEVQRLLALGKVIARRPLAKVSIEGFGDLPGSEPLMVGIAKHRAKVAQTLLAKAGVTEDRVTTAFADMGTDARLARSIRLTTTPSLSEIDKP